MDNRKNTHVDNLQPLITEHRDVLPPVQGALEMTAELSLTAHGTKPAFAASSEPMGEFPTILYLPVRRHTYRMGEKRQRDSNTAILLGILKKSGEA